MFFLLRQLGRKCYIYIYIHKYYTYIHIYGTQALILLQCWASFPESRVVTRNAIDQSHSMANVKFVKRLRGIHKSIVFSNIIVIRSKYS